MHQLPVLEMRLPAAADAMLCRLPFWYSVSAWRFVAAICLAVHEHLCMDAVLYGMPFW